MIASACVLHTLNIFRHNYECRRLLLGTMLLCAASDAGDMEEVVRLVSTSYIKPNGRGLRHKSALHLACARGHKDVANFLLLNGVSVHLLVSMLFGAFPG